MITHKSVVESQDSLVFIVCMSSDSEAKKLKSFVKDLSQTVGGIKQMSFFYRDEIHFKVVSDGLLYDCETASETRKMQTDIANRSLKIEWSQLKTFVEENCRLGTVSDKLFITSSGMPAPVQAKVLDIYSQIGLEILALNECDELRDDPNLVETANKCMMDFLTGKPPKWSVFFFTEETRIPFTKPVVKGLIERDIVMKIVKRIQQSTERTDKCMKIIPIDHLPGTGATTIAKHVLWKLRKVFRCAMIDCNISNSIDCRDLAQKLLSFRGLQEKSSTIDGTSTTSTYEPFLLRKAKIC